MVPKSPVRATRFVLPPTIRLCGGGIADRAPPRAMHALMSLGFDLFRLR
jgi:hypothetical protein